jgi:L-2-hydroxyglutarate oxidase LhgO
MSDFDAAIVGAGAVGLACGYALARRGLNVVVLERERIIGSGVSSRNSEVIHAGLYYPTGSIKGRLCIEGRRLLYAFAAAHNVAHDKCGKFVVATDESEIPAIDAIERQAAINGVENVTRISGADARAREPALRAVAALDCAESGIIDSHGFMFALQGEIEAHGGAVVVNAPFAGAAPHGEGYELRLADAGGTRFTARRLVIAAGLGAQTCASLIENYPAARIPPLHLGKGNYFALTGLKAPFARLIYPPPIPGALGTHYRRDLGGVARFGPDLEWVESEDYSVDPLRAVSFYDAVRKFWPGLPDNALVPDYAGIRPKLHGPGEKQGDFIIDDPAAHGLEGLVALFGIESPGLTASLALGDYVAERLRT